MSHRSKLGKKGSGASLTASPIFISMRTLILLLFSINAFAQITPQFYTYFKVPGGTWQWGRVTLPQGTQLTPIVGSPCADTKEPCVSLTWPIVAAEAPGTTNVDITANMPQLAKRIGTDPRRFEVPGFGSDTNLVVTRNGLQQEPNYHYTYKDVVVGTTFDQFGNPLTLKYDHSELIFKEDIPPGDRIYLRWNEIIRIYVK